MLILNVYYEWRLSQHCLIILIGNWLTKLRNYYLTDVMQITWAGNKIDISIPTHSQICSLLNESYHILVKTELLFVYINLWSSQKGIFSLVVCGCWKPCDHLWWYLLWCIGKCVLWSFSSYHIWEMSYIFSLQSTPIFIYMQWAEVQVHTTNQHVTCQCYQCLK